MRTQASSMARASYESLTSEYSVATNFAFDRVTGGRTTSTTAPPVPTMPALYEQMPTAGFTQVSALRAAGFEQSAREIPPYRDLRKQDHDTVAGAEQRESNGQYSELVYMTRDDADRAWSKYQAFDDSFADQHGVYSQAGGFVPKSNTRNGSSLMAQDIFDDVSFASGPRPDVAPQAYPYQQERARHVMHSGEHPKPTFSTQVDRPVLTSDHHQPRRFARHPPLSRPGLFRRLSTKIHDAVHRPSSITFSSSRRISAPIRRSSVYDQRSYPNDTHPTSHAISIAEAQALRRKGAFTELNPAKAVGPVFKQQEPPMQTERPARQVRRLKRETNFGDFVDVPDSASDSSDRAGASASGVQELTMEGILSGNNSLLPSRASSQTTALTSGMIDCFLGVAGEPQYRCEGSDKSWPPRTTSKRPELKVNTSFSPFTEEAYSVVVPKQTASGIYEPSAMYAADIFDPIDDAVANLQLSPRKAQGLNREIHRLQQEMYGQGALFDDDDDAAVGAPQTTIDTFPGSDRTSFVLTYRPDASTAKSWYLETAIYSPLPTRRVEPELRPQVEERQEQDEAARLWQQLGEERVASYVPRREPSNASRRMLRF